MMQGGRRMELASASRVGPGLSIRRASGRVLVALCLIAATCALAVGGAVTPAGAATMSVDQFVSTYNNRYVDFDGVYGAQCVDLFLYYNRDVVGAPPVWGNAYQLYDNAPTAYYDKLPASATPAKGDVAVWDSSLPGSNTFGHVAIVLSVASPTLLNVFEQNAPVGSNSHIGTFSTSYLRGYLHPKNLGSGGITDGTFVAYSGHVYRIAGGAPIYVSSWTPFGGPQPTMALSAAQFAGLRQYPSDGTFVNEAGGVHVYRVAGGAPIYVGSWAPFGGPRPTIAVDPFSIDNPGPAPLDHLRLTPADGSFITAATGGHVYRVAGGAPIYVSSWTPFGGPQPATAIDAFAIDNAGGGHPFQHLRMLPADGTFITAATGGHVFRMAGGAPIYVSSWTPFGGSQPATAVDVAAIDSAQPVKPWYHLRYTPADGTALRGLPDGTLWKTVGGAPYRLAGSAPGGVVDVDAAAISNAGAASPWSHLSTPVDAGVWFESNSVSVPVSAVSFRWGDGGPQVLACDTDGDNRDGPVTFRNGTWRIAASETPTTRSSLTATVSFGTAGDIAVCGDWDGDGRDGIGLYRPSEGGQWYLRNAASTGLSNVKFIYGRQVGDKPVVGDWDRDGRDEPGIFRGAGGWSIGNLVGSTVTTTSSFTFGASGDVPLSGDWDGDGSDGVGLRRGTTRYFYLRNTASAGLSNYRSVWGTSTDRPVVGDWNTDNKDSIGLVRVQPLG